MQKISWAAAAVNILDDYLKGLTLNKALKKWFKSNRFAGSNDRRKIRDLVYDILRKRSLLYYSFQINDYIESGRILVLTYLFLFKKESFSLNDINNNNFFSPKIKESELLILDNIDNLIQKAPNYIFFNYPEFLEKKIQKSLGKNFKKIMEHFQVRAPVYLRVNQIKTNTEQAKVKLTEEGIICENCSSSRNALKVLNGEKFIQNSLSYKLGNIELQDLSSQLTTELSQISSGKKILDFCSGSGGKALAIASRLKNNCDIYGYDINTLKIKNLVARSQRAGVKIKIIETYDLEHYMNSFDIVFVDAPCSGIGTWRRDPEFKWKINDQKLNSFITIQLEILNESSFYLRNGGFLIYVVCSFLEDEGELNINKFLLTYKNFSKIDTKLFHPINASDGFYLAVLQKNY